MHGADCLATQWKDVTVRGTALFVEESVYHGTQWVVFEPNDEPPRARIRLNAARFADVSGTGKTMAAQVIGSDLGLDLIRIDLRAVVSKYVGETENNLRSVFDAAKAGGAALLLDEAGALFGIRSAFEDRHDRYANLESPAC